MMELARLAAKFEENVLDATNAWSHHVTDAGELDGHQSRHPRAGERRAHEQQLRGWLFGLDQPTYVAVVTDGESAPLRRAFYEAWATRALGPGAERRTVRQRRGDGGHPAAAA